MDDGVPARGVVVGAGVGKVRDDTCVHRWHRADTSAAVNEQREACGAEMCGGRERSVEARPREGSTSDGRRRGEMEAWRVAMDACDGRCERSQRALRVSHRD